MREAAAAIRVRRQARVQVVEMHEQITLNAKPAKPAQKKFLGFLNVLGALRG